MAGLSDGSENKLLNVIFNQTNWTAPTAIYMSLHTADPGDTGTNEHASSGGYARVDCTSSFPTATGTGGSISNDVQINFPTATADWTTVTHWGIWDASTSGNFLLGGSLTTPRTATTGTQEQVLVGALTITATWEAAVTLLFMDSFDHYT